MKRGVAVGQLALCILTFWPLNLVKRCHERRANAKDFPSPRAGSPEAWRFRSLERALSSRDVPAVEQVARRRVVADVAVYCVPILGRHVLLRGTSKLKIMVERGTKFRG